MQYTGIASPPDLNNLASSQQFDNIFDPLELDDDSLGTSQAPAETNTFPSLDLVDPNLDLLLSDTHRLSDHGNEYRAEKDSFSFDNMTYQPTVNYGSNIGSQSSSDAAYLQDLIHEQTSPGCWLSICSPSGIAWIKERTRSEEFEGIATELARTWTKQLRLDRNEPAIQSIEPGPQLAWAYSNAYFDRSVDSIFEVVNRTEFEQHLRVHLAGRLSDYDPASFALRNTVFASGCRISRSLSYAASFSDIQKEAERYFSNALSAYSDLLLRSPSIQAVRALLAMALFAEGLGSPALGSGLIANAALLSQSLGLHRQCNARPAKTDPGSLQRAWLFWAVYCCEKNIARRVCRPSVFDDNIITREIPSSVHPSSSIDHLAVRPIIKSCQISSFISQKLTTAENMNDAAKLLNILTTCDKELSSWKDSLPIGKQPQDHFTGSHMSPDSTSVKDIILYCSYYELVMTLHTLFAYPWMTKQFMSNSNPAVYARLERQISKSSQIVADAAKNMIIMARSFHINGANTYACMLHYPMHAFMNLFVHVVKHPTSSYARNNLALLDVAAGYFGQMGFITGSKFSFPFSRDISALGRRAVENCSGSSGAASTRHRTSQRGTPNRIV